GETPGIERGGKVTGYHAQPPVFVGQLKTGIYSKAPGSCELADFAVDHFGIYSKVKLAVFFFCIVLLCEREKKCVVGRRKRLNIVIIDGTVRFYEEERIWNIINRKTKNRKRNGSFVV